MLQSALIATLNLLFFRAGPQDFPYDPRLTGWLVPFTVLSIYFMWVLALPPVVSATIGLAVVVALGFTTRLYVRARKFDARFMQTFHALLAVRILTTLAMIFPFSEIAPQLKHLAEMKPSPTEPLPEIQVSLWVGITMDLLVAWNFAVSVHIYRQAGNAGLLGGIVVALLTVLCIVMFTLFFGSFVGALVGVGAGAPG